MLLQSNSLDFATLVVMAGYSSTPLVKKLGIKPGFRICVHQPPPGYFDWLHPLPADIIVVEGFTKGLDFVHLFLKDKVAMRTLLLKSKRFISEDGMIWVSWPKKTSGVKSELDENIVRDFGLKNGLVDIKVCAVDEVWAGLKFVIPVKYRNGGQK